MHLNIVEIITYTLIGLWLLFSIYYIVRAWRNADRINPYIFESIPQVFPSIGILGTFLGIAYGLWFFNVDDIEGSIPKLITGLKTAFLASIGGVGLMLIFSKLTAIVQRKNEKGKQSDETILLVKVVQQLEDLNNNFVYINEEGHRIKSANFFRDLYQESQKQSQALQTFSTDLAIKIEAGFENIMSNQIQGGVIPELQSLKAEVENLGKKLQDPTTEMTQNVVKELQVAMGNMIDEFKVSVSGSTKSELEQLSVMLSNAGNTLVDFPDKLQLMTNNLNDNFRQLQDVVQQIAQQTLVQSESSTAQMKQQVQEMSIILKEKVGELQVEQATLISKQSQNLEVSDHLLAAFNQSIEKMNGLSREVTETINRFGSVQREFSTASVQLRSMTENVRASSSAFREAQQKFAVQSAQFLTRNAETITHIDHSLGKAKEVSTEYVQKFAVIEKGLQGIFSQIEQGLKSYQTTVNESLSDYLTKYTTALTKTTDSLASASAKQEDILNELNEQFGKITIKRN